MNQTTQSMSMAKPRKNLRYLAVFLTLNLLYEIIFPTAAWALTGGPSQPEVQSFEPVGTTDMVDLFSGDFNYNIPLLDVEGYPINIAYHGGVGMDQEASWVGLGWNINPGVINRGMQGLPDDFNGDRIEQINRVKPYKSWGVTAEPHMEFWSKETHTMDLLGKEGLSKTQLTSTNRKGFGLRISFGIKFNNYKGFGFSAGVKPSRILSNEFSSEKFKWSPSKNIFESDWQSEKKGWKSTENKELGFPFNFDSQDGMDADITWDYSKRIDDETGMLENTSHTVSTGFNSRTGVKALTWTKERMDRAARTYSFKLNNYHSYIPSAKNPTGHAGFTGTVKYGFKAGAFKTLGLNGFENSQWNRHENRTGYDALRGFGAMYYHNVFRMDVLDNFVSDFNRHNESVINKYTKYLPYSTIEYDQFSASGQGIGGSFRLKHSYVPLTFDDDVNSYSTDVGVGVNLGVPVTLKWGVDVKPVFMMKKSGCRIQRKSDYNWFQKGASYTDELYEPAYFKNVGEKTAVDDDFYTQTKANAAEDANELYSRKELENTKESAIRRHQRDARNQVMQCLTAGQIDQTPPLALDAQIMNYEAGNISYFYGETTTTPEALDRIERQNAHHISELTVYSDDGRRYVYGIPAMNTHQVEQTFTTGVVDANNRKDGLISYSANGNNDFSPNPNPGGKDDINYAFNSQRLPRYAHSYLITGVLSPDYIDRTQNGITSDDYGSAVKFNYSLLSSNYRWRSPYQVFKANYQPGLRSTHKDDRGNIMYGSKEIWMMHSIETKNYIAVFELEDRDDAHGANDSANVNSGDDGKLKRLKSIKLFARNELKKLGADAVPIKTVHFEYDYTLCNNVPNNKNYNSTTILERGKLTLKKIYFTYGKSNKGKYTAYQFAYSENNPDYYNKAYDRWGNYSRKLESDNEAWNDSLSNSDFPYVTQDRDEANRFADSWSLVRIDLPSGGTINVTYESDDYAYVQQKKAMQMCKIIGVGKDAASFNINDKNTIKHYSLYDNNFNDAAPRENYNYLFFKMNNIDDNPDAYLSGIDTLYFNAYTHIWKDKRKDHNNHYTLGQEDFYEPVVGFAAIENDGTARYGKIANTDVGWVKLKIVPVTERDRVKGRMINAISKEAMNFTLKNLPELVYPGSNPKATGRSAWKGLVNSFSEIKTLWKSIYKTMQDRDYCDQLVSQKSYIRLNQPNGFKKGGGVRVKKIEITDNWKAMQSSNAADYKDGVYGQEYEYITKDEKGVDISSGVAAYEPQIGGDENPYRQPIITVKFKGRLNDVLNIIKKDYPNRNKFAKREYARTMGPIGEDFYPAAQVGYSTVTVNSLAGTTGKTVTEFYTAKDYPTIIKATKMLRHSSDGDDWEGAANLVGKLGKNWGEQFLKFGGKLKEAKKNGGNKRRFKVNFSFDYNYYYGYQGYLIINNDMHGKIKAQYIYAQNSKDCRSYVKYRYDLATETGIKGQASCYDYKTNKVEDRTLGQDFDMNMDKQAERSLVTTADLKFNLDQEGFPAAFPVFTVAVGIDLNYTDFKTRVILKTITQYGLLKSTEAGEDGSVINTENIVYDKYTGEVLITKTQNEYNNPIYNITIPAHWAYDGMGQAYRNMNAEIWNVKTDADGYIISPTNIKDILFPGDEVSIVGGFNAWVHEHNSALRLLDKNGNGIQISSFIGLKVIRSGRRNMQNIPIGSIVTLANPIDANNKLNIPSDQVLNASASEFSEDWQPFGKYDYKEKCNLVSTQGNVIKNLVSAIVTSHKQRVSPTGTDPFNGWESAPVNFSTNTFGAGQAAATHYTASEADHSFTYSFNTNGNSTGCSKLCVTGTYDDCHQESKTKYYVVAIDDNQDQQVNITDKSANTFDLVANSSNELRDMYYYIYSNGGNIFTASHYSGIDNTSGVDIRGPYTDSIAPNNCRFVSSNAHETPTCITNTVYKNFFISKSLYDNLNPSGGTGYLYTSSFEYSEPVCQTYDFADATSLDMTTFQNVPGCATKFKVQGTLSNGKKIWFYGSVNNAGGCDDCGTINLFENCCNMCVQTSDRFIVNPYLAGTKGVWRKKADYAYHAKRKQTTVSSAHKPDTKIDGAFENFAPYWIYNLVYASYNKSSAANWAKASEVTVYNPFGQELENKDALGIFSAALFGYENRLPVAVAKNAKYTQIGFDGFEDYPAYDPTSAASLNCADKHFGFMNNSSSQVTMTKAHSGKYSYLIDAGNSETIKRSIKLLNNPDPAPTDLGREIYNGENVIQRFTPEAGDYLVGCWAQEEGAKPSLQNNYTDVEVKVVVKQSCDDEGVIYILKPSGPVIEGWQRIEGKITIPSNARIIEVSLVASNSHRSYFDDLRIQPYRSNMKTYVFDQTTQKLMAELDENNFATFYEYDMEGQLARVKKETTDGIVTLKEVRTSMIKK
jgi:hypothetical protein